MKLSIKLPVLFYAGIFALLPGFVSAATLTLSELPQRIGVGDTVEITLYIDSEVPVNALTGVIEYPADLLEFKEINDGNSIVNPWIERPKVTEAGKISFAGVIPGGYSGRDGKIVSVLMQATKAGNARLTLSGVEVLRADGAGTPEKTTHNALSVSIQKDPQGGFAETADTDPPEPFVPEVARLEQHEVVFSAVDKGSGVVRYEVAESRLPFWLMAPRWQETTSPYVVRDQFMTSDIVVRAIDRAGNVRVAHIPKQHLLRPYERTLLLVVAGLLALLILWYKRRA